MGLGFFIFLIIVLPLVLIFSVKKLRNCFFDWIQGDVVEVEVEEKPEDIQVPTEGYRIR
jgi:hypothetical protein